MTEASRHRELTEIAACGKHRTTGQNHQKLFGSRACLALAWALMLTALLLGSGGGGGGGGEDGTVSGPETPISSPSPDVQTGSNMVSPPDPAGSIAPAADWNGLITFHLRNQTGGAWNDDQIHWAIIGRDWATGEFVHVSADGQLVPLKLSDNNALLKGGQTYSNYFHTLAQAGAITVPPLDSARVMMSVGSPMYLKVVIDGAGKVAYAGANIENPSDPQPGCRI